MIQMIKLVFQLALLMSTWYCQINSWNTASVFKIQEQIPHLLLSSLIHWIQISIFSLSFRVSPVIRLLSELLVREFLNGDSKASSFWTAVSMNLKVIDL